jgi:hypothetical protein
MNKDEIIELWKSVGWNSLKDYQNHLLSGNHNYELNEYLDPDKINPKEFWMACDEHFSVDPVCNTTYLSGKTPNIKESNEINFSLILYLGLIGYLHRAIHETENRFGKVNLAEIGCGYGSFYENSKLTDFFNYTGFDIIKRVDYAVELLGEDGTFSDSQLEEYIGKFNIFFSANTFQHLSPKQIKKYLTQFNKLLPIDGQVVLTYCFMNYLNGEIGRSYHYGQICNIIPLTELIQLFQAHGFQSQSISQMYLRDDNLLDLNPVGFLLKKTKHVF